MTLKEWIAGQNNRDTTVLLRSIHAKQQTGVTASSITQKPRPAQRVADENAWNASLSKEKSLIQTALRLAGIAMGEMTGNETEPVDEGLKPIYAKSLAEQNMWGDTTADQIEAAASGVTVVATAEKRT